MAKLNPSAVEQLLARRSQTPLVTIYMPTHNAGTPPNMSEDEVRFKNLQTRVMGILRASPEVDAQTGRKLANRLRDLADDRGFWESRTYGLAIFISPDDTVTFELPIDCDEYVAVDSRFHAAPIIGLLDQWVAFYVLVLSQKEMRLFAGDMYGLRPTDIEMPAAGTKGNGRKPENKPTKKHVPAPPTGGRPAYFDKGFPLVTKDDRLDFFRTTDQAVRKYADHICPLILAGPESDIEMYRSISQYTNILSGHVPSANSATTPHSLAPSILRLIGKEILSKRRRDATERYGRLAGSAPERASAELPAIQEAASKGRIATLLVKLIRNTADTVRDNKFAVPKLKFFPDEQMAVADHIILQTWRNHGNVVLIDDTSTTPPHPALAAIMRY